VLERTVLLTFSIVRAVFTAELLKPEFSRHIRASSDFIFCHFHCEHLYIVSPDT
jgi:hypothetical protein